MKTETERKKKEIDNDRKRQKEMVVDRKCNTIGKIPTGYTSFR